MNILLIEDESSIAESVMFSCKQANYTVTWAQNGKQALMELSKNEFHLIILDIGLPDINGLEICKEIRKGSSIPIIILTALDSETDKVVGLELGADDYIVKPFSPRELTARIKSIFRRIELNSSVTEAISGDRETANKDNIIKYKNWSHDKDKATISYQGYPIALSRYEYNLLLALLGKPEKVFSRSELMDRAWEVPDMSLERTVDSHVKSIRAKLREITTEEVIITHRGFGYSVKD